MQTLNWSSLNSFIIKNLEVAICWGLLKDEVKCCRIRIKDGKTALYLCRRELVFLRNFLRNETDDKEIPDFKVETVTHGIIITKSQQRIFLLRETWFKLHSVLLGLIYVMERMTPELYESLQAKTPFFFHDYFPLTICPTQLECQLWELEKLIQCETSKNQIWAAKEDQLWKDYEHHFVKTNYPIEKITEGQFKQRLQGQFLDNVRAMLKENNALFTSLVLLTRHFSSITPERIKKASV